MFKEFYEEVKKVPYGKVTTYGRIACLAGFPRCAKFVGWALHTNPDPQNIPCHRVVKKDGSLSEVFAFGGISTHAELLKNEGVEIDEEKQKVKNLEKYLYP
ncbi:MAG: MGMT family protein [Defluviitaleaceae bacterium]|nr:MGMT family protein [Defluviitaleaceae bacterium]